MNELLKKIKGLDKKILIGGGAGVAVVIILIIALLIGGGDETVDSDSTQGATETNAQTESQQDDLIETETETLGTESDTEAVTETELGTETEMETETETQTEEDTQSVNSEESNSGSADSGNSDAGNSNNGNGGDSGNSGNSSNNGNGDNSGNANGDADNSNTNGNDGGQQQSTENPNGEVISGEGSASQPYMEIPDASMTVNTISIPAGKIVYYSIRSVGNMILNIENANAYVITSDGTRYDAKNGKVSFEVENAMANEYVVFQIGNKATSAMSFTLKFYNQSGSRQNPEVVSSIAQQQKSLAEGNEVGYYYKYVAEKSGKIRFYMTATEVSEMTVTNNRNSATRTFDADGLTDEQGRQYIELEVVQGDVLMIQISALPTRRGKYPATTITWEGKFI